MVTSAGCPGINATKQAAPLASVLAAHGYTGTVVGIDYYCGDGGGVSIDNAGPAGYLPPPTLYDANSDIKRLGYDLAWFIWKNYTSHGTVVSIASHSMGGLIARWALYGVQNHLSNAFPPYLYVQDVVTLSTPHDGLGDVNNAGLTAAQYNAVWCGTYTECTEMTPGSAFLNELHQSGMNPQPNYPTDWTAIGASASCDIMTFTEASDMGDVHKVDYTASSGPTCYNHSSYTTDTSTATDAPVSYRGPGQSGYTVIGNGDHSLQWVWKALTSASW